MHNPERCDRHKLHFKPCLLCEKEDKKWVKMIAKRFKLKRKEQKQRIIKEKEIKGITKQMQIRKDDAQYENEDIG